MVAETAVKPPAHLSREYTVLAVAGQPNAFYVAGAVKRDDTQQWYFVILGCGQVPDRCECEGFKFRGTCRHLKAVLAFILEGKRLAADKAAQWFLSLDEQARRELFR